jgi:hypothetical protein
VVAPEYGDADFVFWLRAYVKHHGIRAIVPSEGCVLAIRPVFEEFAPLLPLTERADILYAGMSKADQIRIFTETGNDWAGAHLPPTLLIENLADPPRAADLEALGLPLFIKVDSCYSRDGEDGRVWRAASVEEALHILESIGSRFDKGLIQGHVPGNGVGAFFLIRNGRVLAEFMHRRLHEVPHTGGVSSLRASWWHQRIRDDALAKLRELGWEGIAMMEYRWNPASDEFYFIEMNARFWGSLHLALFAGVDFPQLLMDAFFGHPPAAVERFPLGVRCRVTFPGEVNYVWSRWNDKELSLTARCWSIVEFFLLSLDPKVHSDLWFPGDRMLYWHGVKRFVRSFFVKPSVAAAPGNQMPGWRKV